MKVYDNGNGGASSLTCYGCPVFHGSFRLNLFLCQVRSLDISYSRLAWLRIVKLKAVGQTSGLPHCRPGGIWKIISLDFLM